ncbi:MAG: FAD-binding oxidoreductase [Alphaproteobacteria bacterium]|nr:FAD-binding oxidoreductase [Alphaproteobacteria bacterium]MBV9966743.1 FAD-binding oxidoreductase [Alphaproteobacteria bacterium]
MDRAQRIVIIGGGVIGSAIAACLGERQAGSGVIVVERDPTYRRASSALSTSSIRQQFSIPINVALSQAGIAFLRSVAAEVGLVEPGYLYLAGHSSRDGLARQHAVQRRCDAPVALLSPSELKRRFPWLDTQGLALGSFGLSGEGWFDGYALLQLLRRRAMAAGARYVTDAATGLDCKGSRVATVRLGGGDKVACDIAVNAAGPWASIAAAWAGIELPVRPRRRSVYVVDCRERPAGFPLTIDPCGLWFRPEGAYTICGMPSSSDSDADEPPLELEHQRFEPEIWPALARRVPAFEAAKLVGGWAGYYDYNTFDQNAVIGPAPGFDNFILANGFSGHGLQQAPAVGRAVAEWITSGRYLSLDLSPLGYKRIAKGQPLRENNII